MIEETSAGIVVFRREQSGILFLLLRYPSGHWDFVKGKVENGESLRQTAVREAEEETGISDIEFVEDFEEWIKYDFEHGGEYVSKKVVFFLGRTGSSDIQISHEHLDYAWERYEDAMRKVTFENARGVLAKSRIALGKALHL